MPFNPVDLRGPEFLLFYAAFATCVILLAVLVRRASEGGDVPSELAFDPCSIAYLRGGRKEAIHVAALSLLDRELLQVDGSSLRARTPDAVRNVRRPLERALLERLAEPTSAADLYAAPEVQRAAEALGEPLRRMGLLPAGPVLVARWTLFSLGLALVAGVAGAKVLVALSRGRHNIGFLIVMSAAAMIALFGVSHPRVTARGARALRQLQGMFTDLRRRGPQPGGATNELALYAAVFGFAGLALTSGDQLGVIAPPRPQTASSSCGGSSCSGGSSCGGGCGGCG